MLAGLVARVGIAIAPALVSCVASTQPLAPRASTQCPRLESRLLQLAASDRPADFALTNGLDLNSAGVRVIIELAPTADLPAQFVIAIEARSGAQVQGRVAIAELCALASEPAVLRVTAPASRVLQGT